MITIAESLDEHTLNIFTAKCLEYAPNTYIFTKNLSERIILDYSSSLPCAIIRPSSVSPSIKEPMPGWIDNLYGPIGLYVGGGKGIVRIGHCKKSTTENNVPVDAVINAILVTTWKLGLTRYRIFIIIYRYIDFRFSNAYFFFHYLALRPIQQFLF
ncbi:hypothetical protein PUN28_017512 [Cardiocondyla obscurior]